MFGSRDRMRLSTKLIFTYFLVALVAAVAVTAVALPLLTRYQTEKLEEEEQRVSLEASSKLEALRGQFVNAAQDRNPFHEYLPFIPRATTPGQPISRTWPTAPSIEFIREKLGEIAEDRGLRILLIHERDREIKIDTEQNEKKSIEGQTKVNIKPNQATISGTIAVRIPEATITLQDGRQYKVVYRQMGGDNIPNLLGLNLRGQALNFGLALVLPVLPQPNAWADMLPILSQGVLVALVFSLLFGWLLARQMSRPVVRLTEATQAVSRGDYDQHVLPTGGQELVRLAESFNQMISEVADAQRQQRQLIADVSHELKTPLTSIQGFAQAMQDGALRKPEQYSRAAEIITKETARMTRLVNSLLELSKLESGEAALSLQELDLAEILKSCTDSFEMAARSSGVDLLTQFAPPLPLLGDPDRLRQVFNNLLDNALKYTPEGGVVCIKSEVNGDGSVVNISIKDSGAGIPAVDLPHIFERFYQADKSRRRDLAQEGTGLGLAITREIVLAHNGKIEARSEPGDGAEFIVSFNLLVNNFSKNKEQSSVILRQNGQVVNKK